MLNSVYNILTYTLTNNVKPYINPMAYDSETKALRSIENNLNHLNYAHDPNYKLIKIHDRDGRLIGYATPENDPKKRIYSQVSKSLIEQQ